MALPENHAPKEGLACSLRMTANPQVVCIWPWLSLGRVEPSVGVSSWVLRVHRIGKERKGHPSQEPAGTLPAGLATPGLSAHK